jgi:hypothetical protein
MEGALRGTSRHFEATSPAAPPRRLKHSEKQGFGEIADLVQPPIILQDQANKSSTQNINLRNFVYVQQGNTGTVGGGTAAGFGAVPLQVSCQLDEY